MCARCSAPSAPPPMSSTGRTIGIIDVRNGRALAAAIPGAQLTELPGDDHVFLFEDSADPGGRRARTGRPRAVSSGERTRARRGPRGGACVAGERDSRRGPGRHHSPGGQPRRPTRWRHRSWAAPSPVRGARSRVAWRWQRRGRRCGWPPTSARSRQGPGRWRGRVGRRRGAGHGRGGPPGQLWISRVLADLLPGAGFVFEATTSSVAALHGRTSLKISVSSGLAKD
jgi:hypothetical protein